MGLYFPEEVPIGLDEEWRRVHRLPRGTASRRHDEPMHVGEGVTA